MILNKKLLTDKLITFLVPIRTSSAKNELFDFFHIDVQVPATSDLTNSVKN